MKTEHKILIVEDTETLIVLLTQILEDEDYNIEVAVDGEEALKKAESFKPDIILLDVMLPLIDGFSVCRKLKENPLTKEIPVIFLTGKSQTEDIVEGLKIGAVDYVVKPFEETVLLARIKTHIELKDIRDKIEEANKSLSELNATKDKFFSIIAHDLRSPFVSLLGFSQHLVESVEDLTKEETAECAHYIHESSEKVFALLENLLTWARSQTGRLKIEPESFDLWDTGCEVVDLLTKNALTKEIKLNYDIPRNTMLYADKNMIETVIRNLVSNAIKFSKQGGVVSLDISKENDTVKIEVKDSGVGMDETIKNNLFHIEKCVSIEGTDGEKGTGLGLILCKDFIEKNGGSISVTSEENKGSSFVVTFLNQGEKLPLTN